MTLNKEERDTIVTLELEKAKKAYEEAVAIVQLEFWEVVGNRLYYSLFHAVSALLINDSHEVGTHRGAVNMFSLYYVKTGIFTAAEGKLYSQLQKLREDGDYNCSIDIDESDISAKVEPTRLLIEKIKQYIAKK